MIAGRKEMPQYGTTDADKNRRFKNGKQYRELFPSILTIALFTIFGSSIINGVRLAQEPNAKYWVGECGYAVLAFPPLLIIAHIVQSYHRRPLYLAIVFSCAIPPLMSVIIGFMYMDPVDAAASRLLSTDCTTFANKFLIQQAYLSANTFYDDCLAKQAKNTSTTVEVVKKNMVITQCPGYNPEAAGYPREWSYLQELEQTENCAGWCFDGEGALWTHNPSYWNSCSAAAGMTLKNMVARNAVRMLTNGVVSFVMAALLILGINEWITRSGDPSLQW